MRIKDKFAELFNEPQLNPRFENWLLNSLISQNIYVNTSQTDLRNALADCIAQQCQLNPHVMQQIKQDYGYAAVREELLDWIGDDPWQNHWIQRQFFLPNLIHQTTLTDREKTILMIDVSSPPFNQNKAATVGNLKQNWMKQVEKDKKYRWFFDKDKELKLPMLAEWVNKNIPPAVPQPAQQAHHANQERRFYEPFDVLVFFNFETTADTAKLCLDSIKKRWSQAKYREGLTESKKKQCNIILPDKTLKQLDEMADKYLVKRTQILEVLIRFEAEQKRYLPAWIKRLNTDHLDEGTT